LGRRGNPEFGRPIWKNVFAGRRTDIFADHYEGVLPNCFDYAIV